ncbi:DUF4893 domain-containing protein [Roseicyclus persicicus]|uniref:DUF4893 domain-containing protein n=1 Tax=Roseicyclus persicicus TaxID=2650661 RepID=A0A7X6JZ80_9RHOB|nr:DUF4893 domain-containing protein [Roseibacterium persicicum]NKX44533.1 DUF4893 domain-containing protein [Roseibacterium persicicum]
MFRALALAATLALALGPAAEAQEVTIAPGDAARLAAYDTHFGAAMAEAMAGGAPADIAALTTALAGDPIPPAGLEGDWTCRVMKLGGILPLTVYSPFRCRITRTADGGLFLEKLTGSQLTSGRIVETEDGLVYLGVGYIAGAEPITYEQYHSGAIPPSAGQVTSDVGYVEMVSPNRARVLFPAPMLESRFDILELTR